MSGVTNALSESVIPAANQNDSYLQKLEALENRHLETIAGLELRNVQSFSLSESVVSAFSAIRELLRGILITTLHLPSGRAF